MWLAANLSGSGASAWELGRGRQGNSPEGVAPAVGCNTVIMLSWDLTVKARSTPEYLWMPLSYGFIHQPCHHPQEVLSSVCTKGDAKDAKGHTIWSGDEHSNASTSGLPAEDQKEEAKVEQAGLFEWGTLSTSGVWKILENSARAATQQHFIAFGVFFAQLLIQSFERFPNLPPIAPLGVEGKLIAIRVGANGPPSGKMHWRHFL